MGCKARLNTLGRRLKWSPIRELTKYLFYLFLQHLCVLLCIQCTLSCLKLNNSLEVINYCILM